MGIFIGILILSLMMLVHELGHYITGRLLGFKIIEFSIFMGPVITSWTSKKTGIKYSLKLLPIGASVRFVGEEGMGEDANEDPESFNLKPAWKRAIVLSTGAGINILSGIIALSILFSTTGFVTTEISQIQTDSQAATVSLDPGVKVISVNGARIITSIDYAMEMSFIPPDSNVDLIVKDPETGEVNDFLLIPAKKSSYFLGITMDRTGENGGLKIIDVDPSSNEGSPVFEKGDILLTVNGISMADDYDSAASVISESNGDKLDVRIIRNGQEMSVEPRPMLREYYNERGLVFKAGGGFGDSVLESFKYTVSIVKLTFKSIAKIFTGEIAAKDGLSGPVGVVALVGSMVTQETTAAEKIADLLWLFALISLNLGVFNLLPIPALDGSHLLLLVVEKIRGRRLSAKVQTVIVMVGFFMIIGLALLGLVFDIMRLTGN